MQLAGYRTRAGATEGLAGTWPSSLIAAVSKKQENRLRRGPATRHSSTCRRDPYQPRHHRPAASVKAAANATGTSPSSSQRRLVHPGARSCSRRSRTFGAEMERHYFAPWPSPARSAPQLAAAGTSAVLNVLSVLSWYTRPKCRRLRRQSRGMVAHECVVSGARVAGHTCQRPALGTQRHRHGSPRSTPTKTTPPPLRSSHWMLRNGQSISWRRLSSNLRECRPPEPTRSTQFACPQVSSVDSVPDRAHFARFHGISGHQDRSSTLSS